MKEHYSHRERNNVAPLSDQQPEMHLLKEAVPRRTPQSWSGRHWRMSRNTTAIGRSTMERTISWCFHMTMRAVTWRPPWAWARWARCSPFNHMETSPSREPSPF